MTLTENQFDSKDPEEIVPLTFDFSALAIGVSNPVIAVARIAGSADANPATMLSGSPQVSGATVVQKITGGVDGARYSVRCKVDGDNGARWVIPGVLPVESV